jgi:xanthine dehydrogenase accessory factor
MAFYDRVAGLERDHASFAIATVVARRSPVSSHLGDRALVFADGHMEGFVGGSCSRDIVRRHALEAIGSRRPLLLQIRPDGRSEAADGDRDDVGGRTNVDDPTRADRVVIPMSCSSEGAVDVYIEPRVPLRRLIVAGFTPVAEALARIAVSLDYDVVRVVVESELRDLQLRADPQLANIAAVPGVRLLELKSLRGMFDGLDPAQQRDLVAIVASQGHYDELALEVLLDFPIAFIGLLASRRRAATVVGVLAQQGVGAERLAAIRHPVGLDIGARSPGEVAVSILAEIIANASHASNSHAAASHAVTARAGTAIDPICAMDVDTADALYRFDHAGTMYFFCGAGCRATFAADPERALSALGTT